jgi:hypothetical protein
MNTSSNPAARLAAAAALASACALLGACGSTPAPGTIPTTTVTIQPAGSSSSTTAAATGSSSPATSAGPAGCQASGLQARLGAAQGAAGTSYQVIVLTNTANAACTLYGYPGVSFVTGVGGGEVGMPASKDPLVSKTLVTLGPGATANFLLAVHDAGAFPDCKITNVDWLRIFPPGDYGSIYLQYKTLACANPDKSILGVGPVRAGSGSAS